MLDDELLYQAIPVTPGRDTEIGIVAHQSCMHPQDAHTEGMKGRHRHLLRRLPANQAPHPFPHLASRLVGEGHRQDIAGLHPLLQQVRNPVDHRAGLARPRPGKDEDWTLGSLHRLGLSLVQARRHRSPNLKRWLSILTLRGN